MNLTICGSLKFEKEIQEWHERLSLAGHTCYSMVVLPSQKNGEKDWYTAEQKEILDLLHLSKIANSQGIVVVDKDGYVGESTRREIKWANIRGKTVYFTSEEDRMEYLLWRVKLDF